MTNFVTLSQARVGGSRYPLATLHYQLQFGGRAFGPPLCRGCAPATPPYKNMPDRPGAPKPACVPATVRVPQDPESCQRSTASQRRPNRLRQCQQEPATAIPKILLQTANKPNKPWKRFSSRPLVALRGKRCSSSSSAVAVLRGPSRSFAEKRCSSSSSAVAVLRAPSRSFADKRCSSSSSAVAVFRGPSRPFVEKGVAVAVLRGP